MIVLDVSVVITALPDIHTASHFSSAGLSWVQNAYALTFGGLLLLGARAGDLLGRRRVFIAGIALFTFASLLGGLAQSPSWLLGRPRRCRASAPRSPRRRRWPCSRRRFREGPERTRALAWYSAVAGGRRQLGLVLGGMLTDWVSWRWGLFINVPIGLVLICAGAALPARDRAAAAAASTSPGALTSTLGMTALVYGFVRAAVDGWGDRVTLASFAAGARCCSPSFVRIERRAEQPITPLRLFASRERSAPTSPACWSVGGDVLDVLLPDPVPAGRARLQPAAGRAGLPADDRS